MVAWGSVPGRGTEIPQAEQPKFAGENNQNKTAIVVGSLRI